MAANVRFKQTFVHAKAQRARRGAKTRNSAQSQNFPPSVLLCDFAKSLRLCAKFYFPINSGFLFSRKALTPSAKSAVAPASACNSFSSVSCFSNVLPKD